MSMASQRPERLLADTQILWLKNVVKTQDVKINYEEKVLSMLQSTLEQLENKEATGHGVSGEVEEDDKSNAEQMMSEDGRDEDSESANEFSERVDSMLAETRAYQARQQQPQGDFTDAVLGADLEQDEDDKGDVDMGNMEVDNQEGGADKGM
jgi:hypothetical protein